ncbi:hypothetical protein [Prevotella sp. E13-27]|nr:hypothetical protein [Prevotella sp. E13-27]MCK8623596.1 hypothetical protein [Prevotella sp. E13-27]
MDLEYFGHDAYVIFEIVIKGSSWGTVIIVFLDLGRFGSVGGIGQHLDD